MDSRLLPLLRELPHRAERRENAAPPEPGEPAEADVLLHAQRFEEAVELAVFADIGDAVRDRLRGNGVAHLATIEPDPATVEIALRMPHDHLRDLAASRADQAGYAGDLAGEDREGHLLTMLPMRMFSTRRTGSAARALAAARASAMVLQLLADHVADQPRAVEIGGRPGHHHAPLRSTEMRSAWLHASSSACEMKIIATPLRRRVRIRSNRWRLSSGVSAAVGSSRMMTRAWLMHGARDLHHLPLAPPTASRQAARDRP